jgi:hypothetical protein
LHFESEFRHRACVRPQPSLVLAHRTQPYATGFAELPLHCRVQFLLCASNAYSIEHARPSASIRCAADTSTSALTEAKSPRLQRTTPGDYDAHRLLQSVGRLRCNQKGQACVIPGDAAG